MKDKYLSLTTGWVVKGTKEIPRLFNTSDGRIIQLTNIIFEYIKMCDGSNKLEDIAAELHVSVEDCCNVTEQFVQERIIELSNCKNLKHVDVRLGEKEPWLKEIHIDITNNCNLRCKHCFWGQNLKVEENICFKKWNKALEDFANCGVANIVISGGESLTSADVCNFVKKILELNMHFAGMFTNGTIWNDKIERILNLVNQYNSNTKFYISLDGRNSEEHDFIRGVGNFDKTINFIKKIIDFRQKNNAKYKVTINSLICKRNYKNLVEWLLFANQLGVDKWRFTAGRVVGNLEKNKDVLKITLKECLEEYKKLIYYVSQHPECKTEVNIENFFTTQALKTKTMYIFNDDLKICDYKENAISVSPKGNVQFCTSWQSKNYGNVFTTNVSDIWYGKELRELKDMKIGQITGCKNCKYLQYCGGGCRLECKDIYSKDENVCGNFEIFETEIVPILKDLGIQFKVE